MPGARPKQPSSRGRVVLLVTTDSPAVAALALSGRGFGTSAEPPRLKPSRSPAVLWSRLCLCADAAGRGAPGGATASPC
eukprot:1176264-Prymnesium_polylepis.1